MQRTQQHRAVYLNGCVEREIHDNDASRASTHRLLWRRALLRQWRRPVLLRRAPVRRLLLLLVLSITRQLWVRRHAVATVVRRLLWKLVVHRQHGRLPLVCWRLRRRRPGRVRPWTRAVQPPIAAVPEAAVPVQDQATAQGLWSDSLCRAVGPQAAAMCRGEGVLQVKCDCGTASHFSPQRVILA